MPTLTNGRDSVGRQLLLYPHEPQLNCPLLNLLIPPVVDIGDPERSKQGASFWQQILGLLQLSEYTSHVQSEWGVLQV